MKIDKNLLIKLRKQTKMSYELCIKALIKTNNDLKLSEKILYNNNKNKNKEQNKLNYKIINFYIYKKKIVLIKIKTESTFIKEFIELKNLIKKFLIILIKYKIKNIINLLNKKLKYDYIKNKINLVEKKTKENIKIKNFNVLKIKNKIITYNYDNKIYIIIEYYTKIKYLTKNICLHILWNKPIFISLKSIKGDIIKNKYKLIKFKKFIIKDKIINKIFKKYTLINQKFIKNNNLSIKNILKIKKINILKFHIWK